MRISDWSSDVCSSDLLTLLKEYYHQELERYGSEPEKAKAFLNVGEYPLREGLNPVQHAALMSLGQGLYNLEEAIRRSCCGATVGGTFSVSDESKWKNELNTNEVHIAVIESVLKVHHGKTRKKAM